MPDQRTIDYYDREAAAYATFVADYDAGPEMARFMAHLPRGGTILDLGCGPGHSAAAFRDLGFDVVAVDAAPAFAREAKERYGIEVRVARFGDLEDVARFDGVWASFSLLHDSRSALPGHLARIHRALRPGGWLYLGLKEGDGEERDGLGRAYTYFRVPEVEAMLADAGFRSVELERSEGMGMAARVEPCLHFLAKRG